MSPQEALSIIKPFLPLFREAPIMVAWQTLEDMVLAQQAAHTAKQEIVDYAQKAMDKIDDAKKRGAYGDLSVIAYTLLNKLIAATYAVA
jgi:hypothetical protein